jgi:Pyruvate/2-oxoacid:ferredoxin oxidoreductase delta subunit
MSADAPACPYCFEVAGYRELTGRESIRVMSLFAIQGTALGIYHALRRDLSYFQAPTGAEQSCRACDQVVRVCPHCDAVSRWISADVLTCRGCGLLFH